MQQVCLLLDEIPQKRNVIDQKKGGGKNISKFLFQTSTLPPLEPLQPAVRFTIPWQRRNDFTRWFKASIFTEVTSLHEKYMVYIFLFIENSYDYQFIG